jgi:hypothetical protein
MSKKTYKIMILQRCGLRWESDGIPRTGLEFDHVTAANAAAQQMAITHCEHSTKERKSDEKPEKAHLWHTDEGLQEQWISGAENNILEANFRWKVVEKEEKKEEKLEVEEGQWDQPDFRAPIMISTNRRRTKTEEKHADGA